MLFFYINLGGGNAGGRWWVGPLVGIALSVLSGVIQDLLAGGGSGARWRASQQYSQWARSGRAAVPAQQQQQQQQQRPLPTADHGGDDAPMFDAIDWILLAVLTCMIVKAAAMVRQRGGLRGLLAQRQRAAAAAAAAARERRRQQERPRPTFESVVAALARLPVERVATRAELEAAPVVELRARLSAAGVDASNCLEKGELVERALSATCGAGSSAEGCAICAEEYASGDVVRVLPCGHRLHVECVDRWLLKSTEHSAPKGCPLCNDDRWLTAAPVVAAAAGAVGASGSGGGGGGSVPAAAAAAAAAPAAPAAAAAAAGTS